MRLILLGPPGSGKGTQAKLLNKRRGMTHISTGDMLRDAKAAGTPAGLKAAPFMDHGKLVPDDVVNEAIAERFRGDDAPTKFVLDGYPRTLAQAASFDQVLRQQFLNLDGVVLLDVDDDEIVRRISGRSSCPNPACLATYHIVKKPPRVTGVCDLCGSTLQQREDDREETVRRRLEVYRRNTMELIPHYRAQHLLHEVCGQGDIESIYNNIVGALKQC